MPNWTLSLQSCRYQPGLPSRDGSNHRPVIWQVFFVVATHSKGGRYSHRRTFNLADGATPCWLRGRAFLDREVLLAEATGHLKQLGVQLEEGLYSPARDRDWLEMRPVPGTPAARVAEQVGEFLHQPEGQGA